MDDEAKLTLHGLVQVGRSACQRASQPASERVGQPRALFCRPRPYRRLLCRCTQLLARPPLPCPCLAPASTDGPPAPPAPPPDLCSPIPALHCPPAPQHYVMLNEDQKNRKLNDLLDALDFNQVCGGGGLP